MILVQCERCKKDILSNDWDEYCSVVDNGLCLSCMEEEYKDVVKNCKHCGDSFTYKSQKDDFLSIVKCGMCNTCKAKEKAKEKAQKAKVRKREKAKEKFKGFTYNHPWICIFLVIILIIGIIAVATSGNQVSPHKTCKSCGRTFYQKDDSSNYYAIGRYGMCNNCYNNYQWGKQFIGK